MWFTVSLFYATRPIWIITFVTYIPPNVITPIVYRLDASKQQPSISIDQDPAYSRPGFYLSAYRLTCSLQVLPVKDKNYKPIYFKQMTKGDLRH